jgi:FAD/FMN-containing dehydrogenase
MTESLTKLDALRATFKGDLVFPDDPNYDEAIARWAANAQRRAALVVYPRDAQDVSETVKWVSENKIPLAVCGGGHSSSGTSSIEGGVVIALSRYFSGVKVDPERKIAYVGGGALWEAVDKAAIVHGLSTVSSATLFIPDQFFMMSCIACWYGKPHWRRRVR